MSGPAGLAGVPIMLFRRYVGALALAMAALALVNATPAQAATITVTSTDEEIDPNGKCTLYEAISTASGMPYVDCPLVGSSAPPHTVAFNIPGGCNLGVCTIRPSVTYDVQGQVTIDGYTQPGASPNTLAVGNNAVLRIELNGELAPVGNNGLKIVGGTVTIRGLVINRYTGSGANASAIKVSGGSNHLIAGNFLGTDANGTIAMPNFYGVTIENPGTTNTTVGGTTPAARNLISGNTYFGVIVDAGSTGNHIEGNYIGTRASGAQALGNGQVGVELHNSPANTVGGTAPGAGNLISGNGYYGVNVSIDFESGNRIQGNLIGTEATGMIPLGNAGPGYTSAAGLTPPWEEPTLGPAIPSPSTGTLSHQTACA